MIEERSAGALVFRIINRKVQYLLLNSRYKRNYWDIPKGRIMKNEDPKITAIREIREETGLWNVEIIDGFEEKVDYYFWRSDIHDIVHKEVIIFLAISMSGNVKLSPEHADYKWVEFEEAKRLLAKSFIPVLEKANNFIYPFFIITRQREKNFN